METFREVLSRLAVPLASILIASGISPHVLSFSGIVFGMVSAYFFVTHQWGLAVGFFALSGLSDVVDGMVARARGQQSPFGSFFDNFCSAYTDSSVFAALIGADLCNPWWGVAALVGTLTRLLTFRLDGLVSPGEANALRTRFPSALFGKGDRIVLIAAGTALGLVNEAVIVVALGTHAVAIYRCRHLYAWEMQTREAAKVTVL
jgi:phosphatidylglycerophosphate synthase